MSSLSCPVTQVRLVFTMCLQLVGCVLPCIAHAQVIVTLPGEDQYFSADYAEVEEVYRIGGLSATWDAFGSVNAIAFTSDGNLIVLDGRAQRLVVVDETGSFVREIGRRGDGPGEFGYAYSMVVDSNGDIVIHDYTRQAYVVYTREGAFKAQVRIEDSLSAPEIRASRVNGVLLSMKETPHERMVERMTMEADTLWREPFFSTWRPAKEHPDGVTFVMKSVGTRTHESGSAERFSPSFFMMHCLMEVLH